MPCAEFKLKIDLSHITNDYAKAVSEIERRAVALSREFPEMKREDAMVCIMIDLAVDYVKAGKVE